MFQIIFISNAPVILSEFFFKDTIFYDCYDKMNTISPYSLLPQKNSFLFIHIICVVHREFFFKDTTFLSLLWYGEFNSGFTDSLLTGNAFPRIKIIFYLWTFFFSARNQPNIFCALVSSWQKKTFISTKIIIASF